MKILIIILILIITSNCLADDYPWKTPTHEICCKSLIYILAGTIVYAGCNFISINEIDPTQAVMGIVCTMGMATFTIITVEW